MAELPLADREIVIAYVYGRLTFEEIGLLVGISSGCNVVAASRIARELQAERRTGIIVTVLCDSAEKYLGEHFWEEE